MHIGVIAQSPGGPLTSSAWIRLLLPLQRLERQGLCQLHTLPPLADPANPVQLPAQLDRLIVQRSACPRLQQAKALITACRARGIPVVLDLDDALFALPADHPERQRYASALPALDLLLARADLRVVSTPVLAGLGRERAHQQGYRWGSSAVLANGLDQELWGQSCRFPRRHGGSPLKLLYVGTPTHRADLELVLPHLDRLAQRQPDAFRLTVVGGAPSLPARPWLRLREVPLRCRRYPAFVGWLRGLPRHDLGLAPLVAHPFNAAKSNIKLLDYAALGLACLCSPGPAYDAAIEAGVALAADPQAWGQRLRWAAAHRLQLRRLAQAAQRSLLPRHSSAVMAREWHSLLARITVQS